MSDVKYPELVATVLHDGRDREGEAPRVLPVMRSPPDITAQAAAGVSPALNTSDRFVVDVVGYIA